MEEMPQSASSYLLSFVGEFYILLEDVRLNDLFGFVSVREVHVAFSVRAHLIVL